MGDKIINLANVTDDQIRSIGGEIVDTARSVYTAANRILGGRVEDTVALFDRVKKVCNMFKCVECDLWLPKAEEHPDYESTCHECVAEMDEY